MAKKRVTAANWFLQEMQKKVGVSRVLGRFSLQSLPERVSCCPFGQDTTTLKVPGQSLSRVLAQSSLTSLMG